MRRLAPSIVFAVALASLNIVGSTFGQFPITELTSISPPGAKQGATVDVTVGGANHEQLKSLVFSHAGITAKQKTTKSEFLDKELPVNNRFTVTVAANVPPGIYEARVAGRFGTSNSRRFVVGTAEETRDNGANRSRETPQELPVGTVINGQTDGNSIDYYKVHLTANQRVLIDCVAQRIDSQLDGNLVLYDADGREAARSANEFGRDPAIDFTAKVEGDYTIAIYDLLYGGSANHFYRLSVHSQPHVDYIFPPVGKAGSNDVYTIYGRNLPGGQPAPGIEIDGVPLQMAKAKVTIPADVNQADGGRESYATPVAGLIDSIEYRHANANPVRIGITNDSIVQEVEPNNDASKPQVVSVPCEFVGQFYPQRDADWIQFDAKKGEIYWIDAYAHRLGQASDPVLLVQSVTKDDKGVETVKDIAGVDDPSDRNGRIVQGYDTSTDDPSYRLAVGADGTYRVMIRDQFGDSRADPRFVYRLRIRKEQHDFRLVAHIKHPKAANANAVPQFAPVVRKGGATLIEVETVRQDGFTGPIEISVGGLPAGVTSKGAVLSGTATKAWVVIEAAENAAAWNGEIQIDGKAKIDDKEVVRRAKYVQVVWPSTNIQQTLAQLRVSPTAKLTVVDDLVAPATIQVGDGKTIETSVGGKVDLPVKLKRRSDFKEKLTLVSTGLPGEIKPGNVTVDGAKTDGTWSLTINNVKAKPGSYTFYLRADTKEKLVRDPQAVAEAEEQQKVILAAVTKIAEELKQATAERAQATKEMAAAANALKQATAAKTAADKALQTAEATAKQATAKLNDAKKKAESDKENASLKQQLEAAQKAGDAANAKRDDAKKKADEGTKTLADVTANNAAMTNAKAAAEKKFQDATALNKRVNDAKKAADKKVADTKKAQVAKDVNIFLASTPVKLIVHPTPLKLSADDATIKQGEKAEVNVKLERMYGFADNVDVTIEPPKGVGGISAAKLQIAKDKPEGKLAFTIAKNAKPGDHAIVLRAKAKYNNVNVETTETIQLKIEEVKEEKK